MSRIDVGRLKARHSIEDVVSRYVRLRRRGRTLVGLCPFHEEKEPSFTVWPGSGWYCFGCDEGGDVIAFVMRIENVDFPEACRILGAKSLPDPIVSLPKMRNVSRKTIQLGRAERQALGTALRVYHARLWSMPGDAPAREYLEKRKIDPDTIRRFGIGWCSGQDLIPGLQFMRMRRQVFLDIGLLGDKLGRLHEFLRGRIVIPDRTPDGRVRHMVGRSIDHREPRYLSLPGLPKPLYGLGSVRRQKPVAVVEGIFCRVSLERCGVQAVAVMGTALRGERAERLKAVPHLYFIPQNDDEGEEATQGWLEAVGHGEVVRLPREVKDVNDLDQAGGLEEWLDTWATWREE